MELNWLCLKHKSKRNVLRSWSGILWRKTQMLTIGQVFKILPISLSFLNSATLKRTKWVCRQRGSHFSASLPISRAWKYKGTLEIPQPWVSRVERCTSQIRILFVEMIELPCRYHSTQYNTTLGSVEVLPHLECVAPTDCTDWENNCTTAKLL